MYLLLGLFLFVVAIAFGAVVMGVWVVFSVLRLIVRGFVRLLVGGGRRQPLPMPGPALAAQAAASGAAPLVYCGHGNCKCVNPATARFCRRCGRPLLAAQRVSARRVAML